MNWNAHTVRSHKLAPLGRRVSSRKKACALPCLLGKVLLGYDLDRIRDILVLSWDNAPAACPARHRSQVVLRTDQLSFKFFCRGREASDRRIFRFCCGLRVRTFFQRSIGGLDWWFGELNPSAVEAFVQTAVLQSTN